ncbi:hypothetical protein B296_00023122, partial [Ensete ventricosum]
WIPCTITSITSVSGFSSLQRKWGWLFLLSRSDCSRSPWGGRNLWDSNDFQMHKPQGGQSQSLCQPLEMHPEPFLRHQLLNLPLELQILQHHLKKSWLLYAILIS